MNTPLKFAVLAILLITTISSTFADYYSTAIMLKLNKTGTKVVNEKIRKHFVQSKKQPHVTVAVMYFETEQEGKDAEKLCKKFLTREFDDLKKQKNEHKFYVKTCKKPFPGKPNITALEPTDETKQELGDLNKRLEQFLNTKNVFLEINTTNANYTPHLTLTTTEDLSAQALTGLNQNVARLKNDQKYHGTLFFKLEAISVSTIKIAGKSKPKTTPQRPAATLAPDFVLQLHNSLSAIARSLGA